MRREREWMRLTQEFHVRQPDGVFPRQLSRDQVRRTLDGLTDDCFSAFAAINRTRAHMDVLMYGTLDTEWEALGEMLCQMEEEIGRAGTLMGELWMHLAKQTETTEAVDAEGKIIRDARLIGETLQERDLTTE